MTSLFEILFWHRKVVLFNHGESPKPTTAAQSTNTQRAHNELMPGMLHNHQSATTCAEKHSLHSVPLNVLIYYSPKCLLHQNSLIVVLVETGVWPEVTSVTTFAIHKKGFQQKPEQSVCHWTACLKILTTLGSTQNPQSTKSWLNKLQVWKHISLVLTDKLLPWLNTLQSSIYRCLSTIPRVKG